MQAIEHELEVTVRVHEVRAEYERQMEEWVLFILFFDLMNPFRGFVPFRVVNLEIKSCCFLYWLD